MRNPHKTAFSRIIQRPLVCAVHNHDTNAVGQLVEGSCVQDIGLALHGAYHNNDLHCLQILAPHAGVEANSWALIAAASQGNIEATRILIPFSAPKTADNLALKMAVIANHWDCVDLLKNYCSSVVCINALNNAVKNNDEQAVDKIIACSAPISTDKPLIFAARFGRDEFLTKIISICTLHNNNSEALKVAAHYGYHKCVEQLIGLSNPKDFPQVLAEAYIGAYVGLNLAINFAPWNQVGHYLKPDANTNYISVFDMLYDAKTVHDTHSILLKKREQAGYDLKKLWNTCIDKFEIWSATHQKNKLLKHICSEGIPEVRKM